MSEQEKNYSSYSRDDLEPASKLRIERNIYFESDKADISTLTALPLVELLQLRQESEATEQSIFAKLQEEAYAWERQAGNTRFIEKAIEYVKTPEVSHTSNKWQNAEYNRHIISNRVYIMQYHIYENTRYDPIKKESVPHSWHLTWSVRTNNQDGHNQGKIAGQDRKVFSNQAAMEKYLNGRIKAYSHLFTELSPPIPQEYSQYFKVNGQLLPGYTIEGEQPQHNVQDNLYMDTTEVTQSAAQDIEQPRPVVPIILSSDKPAEKVKEITARLEQGIQAVFDSDRYKEFLNAMSKFHDYSLNNTLLIAMQGGNLVKGYTQWQKDFDRHVKKDEKGIKIFAPAPYKVKKVVDKINPDTGEPMMGKDGQPMKEEKEVTIPAFKVVSVFDISQTEGKEFPDLSVKPLLADVEQYEDFFAALEKASPVSIAFEQIEGGANGYFSLTDKRIAIKEGVSELQAVKTAIHEIAHAKLHDVDLNAPKNEQNRIDRRSREVQAESVAYTVCQHFGLDTSDYSFGYVAGWSSGKEMAELKASLETIQNTAKELITEIKEHFSELQKQRETVQEQQTSVFDKLPPEQQQDLSDTVKDSLQLLIDADKRIYGDITGNTLEAIAAQGYSYKDGQLEKQPQDIHTFVEKSLNNAEIAFTRFENAEQFQAWVENHAQKPQETLTPDQAMTGERVSTPRGNFSVTSLNEEQMRAAGFGVHHRSEDGQYLIMGNGTQAFAVAVQQSNPLRTIEDIVEQNDNMLDGVINNTPNMPTAADLEQKMKAGEPVSLSEYAKAIQAEKKQAPQKQAKKPSILKQLDEYKKQAVQQPSMQRTKEKAKELEV